MTPRSSERFSLQGRTALVTGASRGIGRVLAIGLAEMGADVAICARSLPALQAVADEIEHLGQRAVPIRCDVTQPDDVAACVARTCAELGKLDVLVNNAGGPIFQAPILDVRAEGWARTLDLNLTSVQRLCQQVGARMVAQQSGSIINIASLLPTRAWPALAAYSAAKAAVLNLTQNMAVAWGSAGVRVNALCPGWIRTELNRRYFDHPTRCNVAVDAVPLARWGQADDLVGAVTWLASDASRYVTGAIIPVDGGLAVGVPAQWQTQMDLRHDPSED